MLLLLLLSAAVLSLHSTVSALTAAEASKNIFI